MNVRHALMAVQIAAPMLAARGRGALAFISSLAAETAAPGQSIYGMAKAALNHLVRYAADEFGPRGVRTNGIGTGLILTPGLKAVSNSTYIKQVIDHVPMRRIGQPSDIAGAVYFLMSDLAAYVNGSILHVEGGDLYGSRGYPHMPPSAG
jgi:7-alpha-hydroxysteroid dehydrogenase